MIIHDYVRRIVRWAEYKAKKRGYYADIRRRIRISSTLREVVSDVRFSIKDYKRNRCKYIQIEKERKRSFMNDNDDIPMIIC